jgi:hypothetical protein
LLHCRPAAQFRHAPLAVYSFDLRVEARMAQRLVLAEHRPDIADGFGVPFSAE